MRWLLNSATSESMQLMGNRFKASAGHCKGSPVLPFPQSEIFLRTMLATDRFKAPQVLPMCAPLSFCLLSSEEAVIDHTENNAWSLIECKAIIQSWGSTDVTVCENRVQRSLNRTQVIHVFHCGDWRSGCVDQVSLCEESFWRYNGLGWGPLNHQEGNKRDNCVPDSGPCSLCSLHVWPPSENSQMCANSLLLAFQDVLPAGVTNIAWLRTVAWCITNTASQNSCESDSVGQDGVMDGVPHGARVMCVMSGHRAPEGHLWNFFCRGSLLDVVQQPK